MRGVLTSVRYCIYCIYIYIFFFKQTYLLIHQEVGSTWLGTDQKASSWRKIKIKNIYISWRYKNKRHFNKTLNFCRCVMKMSIIKHNKCWHQQFIVKYTIYMLMKNSRHFIWIFSHPSVIINLFFLSFFMRLVLAKWVNGFITLKRNSMTTYHDETFQHNQIYKAINHEH